MSQRESLFEARAAGRDDSLLKSHTGTDSDTAVIVHAQQHQPGWKQRWRAALFASALGALIVPFSIAEAWFRLSQRAIDPTNFALRTERVLEQVPLIDGHNDFPWLLRVELHNKIYDRRFDPNERLLGHTDITRMRQGKMGGQFWSVHVHCDATQNHFEDRSVSRNLLASNLRLLRTWL